jgi:hypothetical protein
LKVKDLINQLQQFDPEEDIYIINENDPYDVPYYSPKINVIKDRVIVEYQVPSKFPNTICYDLKSAQVVILTPHFKHGSSTTH